MISAGSGSVSQRYGSADPDLNSVAYQNNTAYTFNLGLAYRRCGIAKSA
jgi:hypothetical protein